MMDSSGPLTRNNAYSSALRHLPRLRLAGLADSAEPRVGAVDCCRFCNGRTGHSGISSAGQIPAVPDWPSAPGRALRRCGRRNCARGLARGAGAALGCAARGRAGLKDAPQRKGGAPVAPIKGAGREQAHVRSRRSGWMDCGAQRACLLAADGPAALSAKWPGRPPRHRQGRQARRLRGVTS
jgi:hypothetical protein